MSANKFDNNVFIKNFLLKKVEINFNVLSSSMKDIGLEAMANAPILLHHRVGGAQRGTCKSWRSI